MSQVYVYQPLITVIESLRNCLDSSSTTFILDGYKGILPRQWISFLLLSPVHQYLGTEACLYHGMEKCPSFFFSLLRQNNQDSQIRKGKVYFSSVCRGFSSQSASRHLDMTEEKQSSARWTGISRQQAAAAAANLLPHASFLFLPNHKHVDPTQDGESITETQNSANSFSYPMPLILVSHILELTTTKPLTCECMKLWRNM